MLKGIPSIISPELLKILMEMGHGDELCIGDGNFPGESMGQKCVRCDGHGVPEVLEAILKLFPLDTYAQPLYLMAKVPGDDADVSIWKEYEEIVALHTDAKMEFLERFDFYERAKNAYAVLMTGESKIYANIIIKKGIVKEN